MPTQEDRSAELERKVTILELKRLYDERMAAENTPAVQAYNYSEISHNLTMLLGVASGQEHSIRLMQGDIREIKDDLDIIKGRLDGVEQRFTSLEGKFEQRFGSLEGKFEQVLHQLAALSAKLA